MKELKSGVHLPHVLVITSNYKPEESGISVYTTDLVENILSSLFKVTVLTGVPHYPWWKKPDKFRDIVPGRTQEGNVDIRRIFHFIPAKPNMLGRSRFEYSFWRNAKRELRKLNLHEFDLVISVIPLVSAAVIATRVAKRFKMPSILIIQDLVSAATLQSGIPGTKFLNPLVRRIENHLIKSSTRVILVSEEMLHSVSNNRKSTPKFRIIHNYTTLIIEHEAFETNHQSHEDKFLVLHTGNIGFKQNLENVVVAAELLKDDNSILFQIVGHGNQEDRIKALIKDMANIEVRPFVSLAEYPKLLSSADILLVNERASLVEMCLPSKLTSYLVSGRPILAAVGPRSATRRFLEGKARITSADSPEDLVSEIRNLKANPKLREELGDLGRKFAIEELSASAARLKYLELIEELLHFPK